jgi:hypothetical protein
MAILCAECNAETYEAVDTETDAKGRSFVLLECRKCRRSIIVPKAKWTAPVKEDPKPASKG